MHQLFSLHIPNKLGSDRGVRSQGQARYDIPGAEKVKSIAQGPCSSLAQQWQVDGIGT